MARNHKIFLGYYGLHSQFRAFFYVRSNYTFVLEILVYRCILCVSEITDTHLNNVIVSYIGNLSVIYFVLYVKFLINVYLYVVFMPIIYYASTCIDMP